MQARKVNFESGKVSRSAVQHLIPSIPYRLRESMRRILLRSSSQRWGGRVFTVKGWLGVPSIGRWTEAWYFGSEVDSVECCPAKAIAR
jgi:hypothetical protein